MSTFVQNENGLSIAGFEDSTLIEVEDRDDDEVIEAAAMGSDIDPGVRQVRRVAVADLLRVFEAAARVVDQEQTDGPDWHDLSPLNEAVGAARASGYGI